MPADLALIRRAQAGEPGALHSLLEGAWPDAYRVAWSVLGDPRRAEDAAQEALARVMQSIGSLRRPELFRAWLLRIVTHEAWRELRRHSRERPAAPDTLPACPAPTPLAAEERLDLEAALAALGPAHRLPLVLHYYSELSSAEIGAVLGIPAATVRFRLATARQRLRQLLEGPRPEGEAARLDATLGGVRR